MKNILNLTNIYFKETLLNTFHFTKKKKRSQLVILFVFIAILISLCLGYTFYEYGDILNNFGDPKNILLIGLVTSLFMIVLISMNDTQGYFYKSNDFEMISSLPIKTYQAITARYLSAYLITLIYTSLVVIPAFVVYFIYCGITAFGIIMGLLSLFFLPTFSQLIGCLLSWIINSISSKMKNKNMARTIFSVIVAIILAILIYIANTDVLSTIFSKEPALWIKIVFAHIFFLQKSIVLNSFAHFLLFLLLALAYATISILMVSLGYKKINTSLNSNRVKKSNKPLVYKKTGLCANLLKKEVSTFFNNPVYCMNGIMGPIMTIVISVICITIYKQNAMYGDIAIKIFIAIQMFSLGMVVGIAPTSAVSLSLEGNKFQVLKSLPVPYRSVVTSKILFNIILSIPPVIVADILFACFVPIGANMFFVILTYHIIAVLVCSIFGMLLNLKFPKLKWSSEQQAVKQGASMLITMFVDMIVAVAPMILYFAFMKKIINHTLYYLLGVIGIYVVVLIVLLALIATTGKKLYNKISA